MDRALLDILLCPACGGSLDLKEAETSTVEYAAGAREEIEIGHVVCRGCGRAYPVQDFVLSLESVFPPMLAEEAAFWDQYYRWLLEQGSYGFHDLHRGQAPYITFGVPEPFPLADTLDRYDIHRQIAEHPLVRRGHTLLDIGVGLGWTSLYLARAGYQVTAFEPSHGPVVAAKRYAMEQGVFVEYMCAALGTIRFKPESFDIVTAFHSLHHVLDLERNLRDVRSWLKPGGIVAIDEHVGNSRLAASLGGQLHAWAEAEIFPRYRTISPEALARLPQLPHSPLEDSSVEEVLPVVERLFKVHLSRPRHVFLDHYPLLYYLNTDRDLAGYRHALAIANQMQELIRQVDPDGGDYVTVIAENAGEIAPPREEIEKEAPPVEEPSEAEEPGPEQRRIAELERQLREQAEWARGLERQVERKNAEIAHLQATVKRLESGRVMRLLRKLTRK